MFATAVPFGLTDIVKTFVKEFSFGATYHTQFFEMPPGYTATDVVRIKPGQTAPGPTYRERPFFECFIDGA